MLQENVKAAGTGCASAWPGQGGATAMTAETPPRAGSGRRSARSPFARRQAAAALAGGFPALVALGGATALGALPPMLGGALTVSSAVALVAGGFAVWQQGRMIDALAARLSAEAGLEAPRIDAVATIDAAFAAAESRLAALARRGDPARRDDPVTGLPNRQTLMRRGRDEITRARRNQQPLAVALLSVEIGPPAEDPRTRGTQERALRLAAEVLMQGLRAYDVVARWEHDVFAALVPEAEIEHAVAALERVRVMFETAPGIRGSEPSPAVHAGVAVLQPDDATVAEIAARAEKALSRARSGVGAAVQAAPGPRQRPATLTSV